MYTTPKPQKNALAAQSYFAEHFTKNDYYTVGEVEPGRWFGTGARILGLKPDVPVTPDAFSALCEGLSPKDGTPLGQRCNSPGNRRVFHDFTCSAPKSVSLLAVTMADKRIVDAHREAARVGIKELEFRAGVRVRANGANHDRSTGNVVGVEFLHDSTRALDPSLHTHFVVFNSTFVLDEGRWKALQTGEMYESIGFATAAYRNELARRLIEMGYEIESRGDGFEIAGVPDELLIRFSKRSAERDKVVKEMETKLGRELTNNEVSIAVHQSRAKKCKHLTREQVRELQLGQMTAQEIELLRNLVADSHKRPPRKKEALETEAISHSIAHLFERNSVCRCEKILQAALIFARGRVQLSLLKSQLCHNVELLPVGSSFTTRQILSKEMFLVHLLTEGKDTCAPLAFDFVPSQKVGADQRLAILHVLCAVDRITGFRGLAGAGKTTALQELAVALQDKNVVYCAPTAAAVDVLRKDGFDSAITLRGLLVGNHVGDGDVIVLDEAGLVGLDDMHELFQIIRAKGCRLILSGDTGQHSSVPRGDALRLLERHSLYRFGELSQIRRQRVADYRQVVELAADKRVELALDKMADYGWIAESLEYQAQAAERYVKSRAEGKSCIVVAPTWREIEIVTTHVRDRLRESGDIGKEDVQFTIFNSFSWTKAQKRNRKQYVVGQRIIFTRKAGRFVVNEEVEVIEVNGEISVRRKCGGIERLSLKDVDSFDVGEARSINIAVGDELLLRANQKQGGLINGQIVSVKSVGEGNIALTDGRVIDSSFKQYSHGYCITSHASQGKTVDHVYLVASSSSGQAVHREQFYVSISRARDLCRIFTDDASLLRDRIGRSTHRAAALDLLGQELEKLGFPVPKPTPTRQTGSKKLTQAILKVGNHFWQRILRYSRRLLKADQPDTRGGNAPKIDKKQSKEPEI